MSMKWVRRSTHLSASDDYCRIPRCPSEFTSQSVRNRQLEMERCFNTNIGTFSVQNVNGVIHCYTLISSEKSVIIAPSNGLALSVLETEMANL